MEPKKSPVEVGQPLLPVQQDPPQYSIGFPPSESYPSTSGQSVQHYGAPVASSGQPVQHYGAPAASIQYIQGPYPGQTVVTVQPPVNVSFTPLTNPEPDYLPYSIFTLLCCCLPLGSAALVYSITTRDANVFGHQPIASKNSRMARILNHVSVAIGLLFWASAWYELGSRRSGAGSAPDTAGLQPGMSSGHGAPVPVLLLTPQGFSWYELGSLRSGAGSAPDTTGLQLV
ncbi:unnamed protein product [Leuciscus chuanchicus]